MLKKIVLIAILTFSFSNVNAQRKDKIKGNKIVTTEETSVEDFTRILIGEDFKVTIVKRDNPFVEITTDENLHEVIEASVIDKRQLGLLNYF